MVDRVLEGCRVHKRRAQLFGFQTGHDVILVILRACDEHIGAANAFFF